MMIRDINGNIHIINRADCKNDTVYYEKIYNIKMGFTKWNKYSVGGGYKAPEKKHNS
jgi:hypothetical protein